MEKPKFKFGIFCIYGGIAVCVFKIIEFLPVFQKTRIESGIDTGLLALVIVAAFIIMGVKLKRNSEPAGSITFLRAFTTGMIIAISIAVITIPFIYVYGKFINPNEAEQMIIFKNSNLGEDALPTPELIHEYYAPRHRSMKTGEEILLTGFIVSFFSAGMFRRVPTTEQDFVKEAVLPSNVRRFFVVSVIFTLLPFIIYILWLLRWANVHTLLFEFLTEPIDPIEDPLALQEGTAFLSLLAFILNIISYNKISEYRHRLDIWNLRMILISIALFLISLWLIVHPVPIRFD